MQSAAVIIFARGADSEMLSHSHPEVKEARWVVFADSARSYGDCTDGVCELLGYSRAEMIERRIEDGSFNDKEVPKLFADYMKRGSMNGEHVLKTQRRNTDPDTVSFVCF